MEAYNQMIRDEEIFDEKCSRFVANDSKRKNIFDRYYIKALENGIESPEMFANVHVFYLYDRYMLGSTGDYIEIQLTADEMRPYISYIGRNQFELND